MEALAFLDGVDLDDFIDFCISWLCSPYCDSTDLLWDYDDNNNIDFKDWAYYVPDMNMRYIPPTQNSKYILTDFMGSVVGISDEYGNTVEISYNAWGEPSYTGDLAGLTILWNGYYYDDETENYYLRNRYYSPLERCFITQDPRGINPDGTWNNQLDILSQYEDGYALQVYATGDPVNSKDAWGLKSVCCKVKWGNGKKDCWQHTINATENANPLAACKCKYKNRSNIKVYGAKDGKCINCVVTLNWETGGFWFPLSHHAISIKCSDGYSKIFELGRPKKGNDLVIRRFNSVDESWYYKHATCDTSKENVLRYENTVREMEMTNWLIGGNNCWTFAKTSFNTLCDSCP